MSLLIDLDDVSSLEKLGQALCKIPSVVISLTQSMIEIPESRKIILDSVYESPDFSRIVENVMLTSDLRPIKRTSELEKVTGIYEFEDGEDHEPTIPERIQDLEEKLENFEYRPTEKPSVEIKPETKTGIRAMHLISKLRASGKDHLTHREIKSILACAPEDYRIDEKAKNPRKTIIDVLNEAVSMCSDVFLDQKKKGHREWRMVLKS